MVTTLSDRISGIFKTVRNRIQSDSRNRKKILVPLFYLGLCVCLAFNAHHYSKESGVLSWLDENPPTQAMISGELHQKGLNLVTDEKSSRQLYRSFPFKNSKMGSLYYTQEFGCIALTRDPEKEALPYFFCDSLLVKHFTKPDWKSLGFGWIGVSEAQKLNLIPKKQMQAHIFRDPREIRY